MNIRGGQLKDILQLVEIDRKAYREYGENEEYFRRKLASPNTKVLVVEANGKVTGFTVFEMMEPDQIPENFSNLELKIPIQGRWMHIIAFTTESNYMDKEADTQLLKTAEEIARNKGCVIFCVPLSVDHPYPAAFPFFEGNGYQRIGRIKWDAGLNGKIDCYFYSKPAQ